MYIYNAYIYLLCIHIYFAYIYNICICNMYKYIYTCFLLSYIHIVQQITNENQWFICNHFDEFCAARHLEQGKPNSPIVNHPQNGG